jgi:ubiquitin-protein ligase
MRQTEIQEDPVEGVAVELENENLFTWKFYIEGPHDTP